MNEFVKKYVKGNTNAYYFWRTFFYPLAWILFRPKIYGKENIAEKGGLIIASNHIHMFDPAYVLMSTPRVVRYLAKKELIDSALGPIYRGLCTIPVDRSGGAHDSIVAAEYALNEDEVIAIFPEGTRNKKGEAKLLPFKYGAVRLASKTGKPIVPVALISKGRPFIDRYIVNIGEAYYIDKNSNLDKENEILKDKILALMEKQY